MASGDSFTFFKDEMSTGQALALATTLACRVCGCGESGSNSGSRSYGLDCCPGRLYTGFCVTISGGSRFDGTYSLTYQTGQTISAGVNLLTCAALPTITADGWFSPWTDNCKAVCTCDIFAPEQPTTRHRIWLNDSGTGASACAIRFVIEVPVCVFPDPGCNGTLAYNNGILFDVPDITSTSCSPLVITWQQNAPGCSCVVVDIVTADAVLTEC